jgi:hypothetical protein
MKLNIDFTVRDRTNLPFPTKVAGMIFNRNDACPVIFFSNHTLETDRLDRDNLQRPSPKLDRKC